MYDWEGPKIGTSYYSTISTVTYVGEGEVVPVHEREDEDVPDEEAGTEVDCHRGPRRSHRSQRFENYDRREEEEDGEGAEEDCKHGQTYVFSLPVKKDNIRY